MSTPTEQIVLMMEQRIDRLDRQIVCLETANKQLVDTIVQLQGYKAKAEHFEKLAAELSWNARNRASTPVVAPCGVAGQLADALGVNDDEEG